MAIKRGSYTLNVTRYAEGYLEPLLGLTKLLHSCSAYASAVDFGEVFYAARRQGVDNMGFFSNLFGSKASSAAVFNAHDNMKDASESAADFEVASADSAVAAEVAPAPVEALCPVSGTAVDIANVADQAFASKVMGDGIGIKPASGELVAPFSGTVEALLPTGHALAIKHEGGTVVMLHVGIDTVAMKGEGFSVHVAQGDHVEQGQLLVTFDREKIAAAGYDDTTMVIAAEVPAGRSLVKCEPGQVRAGQSVLRFL